MPGPLGGRQSEPCPQFRSNALRHPQCRTHFPRARSEARITIFDGKARQRSETSPQRLQRCVARQQQVKKVLKIVRAWHGKSEFLQQRLGILFGRLLTVEAYRVAKRLWLRGQTSGRGHVLFGLCAPTGASIASYNTIPLSTISRRNQLQSPGRKSRSICCSVRTITSSENGRSNARSIRTDCARASRVGIITSRSTSLSSCG